MAWILLAILRPEYNAREVEDAVAAPAGPQRLPAHDALEADDAVGGALLQLGRDSDSQFRQPREP